MNNTDEMQYRPLEEISKEIDQVTEQINQLDRKRSQLTVEHDATADHLRIVPRFF